MDAARDRSSRRNEPASYRFLRSGGRGPPRTWSTPAEATEAEERHAPQERRTEHEALARCLRGCSRAASTGCGPRCDHGGAHVSAAVRSTDGRRSSVASSSTSRRGGVVRSIVDAGVSRGAARSGDRRRARGCVRGATIHGAKRRGAALQRSRTPTRRPVIPRWSASSRAA